MISKVSPPLAHTPPLPLNLAHTRLLTLTKTDWATGGHSENVRLNAWTMNVGFPYDINATGGWNDENGCTGNGTVKKGSTPKTTSAHDGDWKTADTATDWIKQVVKDTPETPFFVFSGMNIVHPPYVTNEYWNEKIDRSKIDVPAWEPLMDMHPCDFQSSMLKGCTPSDEDAEEFYSIDRRKEIRAKYYAMVAEWDAMVGQYVETVKDLGIMNQTVFIVTSDHGDMQMEHQQVRRPSLCVVVALKEVAILSPFVPPPPSFLLVVLQDGAVRRIGFGPDDHLRWSPWSPDDFTDDERRYAHAAH